MQVIKRSLIKNKKDLADNSIQENLQLPLLILVRHYLKSNVRYLFHRVFFHLQEVLFLEALPVEDSGLGIK